MRLSNGHQVNKAGAAKIIECLKVKFNKALGIYLATLDGLIVDFYSKSSEVDPYKLAALTATLVSLIDAYRAESRDGPGPTNPYGLIDVGDELVVFFRVNEYAASVVFKSKELGNDAVRLVSAMAREVKCT